MTAIRTCRGCGCTENDACIVDGIACHWVAEDFCSACEQGAALDVAPEDDPDFCPGAPVGTQQIHRPLWTDDHRGYCVLCKVPFFRRDIRAA